MLMNNQEIHEPAAQTSNTENAIKVNHNIQILEREVWMNYFGLFSFSRISGEE